MSCMLRNTYYWPENMSLNQENESKYEVEYIYYYPFIFILFLVSGALLIAPNVFWRVMSKRSGFGMNKIIYTFRVLEKELLVRDKKNTYLSLCYNFSNLKALHLRKQTYNPKSSKFDFFNSMRPNYIVYSYLAQKVLYVISVLCIFMIWHLALNRKFVQLVYCMKHNSIKMHASLRSEQENIIQKIK